MASTASMPVHIRAGAARMASAVTEHFDFAGPRHGGPIKTRPQDETETETETETRPTGPRGGPRLGPLGDSLTAATAPGGFRRCCAELGATSADL